MTMTALPKTVPRCYVVRWHALAANLRQRGVLVSSKCLLDSCRRSGTAIGVRAFTAVTAPPPPHLHIRRRNSVEKCSAEERSQGFVRWSSSSSSSSTGDGTSGNDSSSSSSSSSVPFIFGASQSQPPQPQGSFVSTLQASGTTTFFLSDPAVVPPISTGGIVDNQERSISSATGVQMKPEDGGGGDNDNNKAVEDTPAAVPAPKKKKKRRSSWDTLPSMGESLQHPAGSLFGSSIVHDDDDDEYDELLDEKLLKPSKSQYFIPQIQLHDDDGRRRKRVLILCTGGTLTMAPDPDKGGALAPVEGALTAYMQQMGELHAENMPEVVAHEYSPFFDSSDLGPADWALLANDIKANYLHFDGFVVLMGTDTMAYVATALSFMLENLGKPVIVTGSQIPLCEPYNDARRNLIMALIFASRDTINEVSIFFHDRLLRACRSTKVNTHRLLAFDSPNMDPLATIGITIDENEHLVLPPARGALRVHTKMDTRLLTIRLVPGFDDAMIRQMIEANAESKKLKALVLQLYGTGNIPSVKDDFIQILADAHDRGILVIAATQCFTGSVMMGHYATGQALASAGVVSASDMTLEAIACKTAYLFGRGDLNFQEVYKLMGVSLRGEVTPPEALSPPPLSSAYQRASRKGKKYY